MKVQKNIDEDTILRGNERIPFEKIRAKLITLGWDSSIEYEEVWGWYLLACKKDPSLGNIIRRVKPFKIISPKDLSSSLKLQERLRSPDLVEVVPYKTYKGIRIFFPEITDFMDFMSEAKFGLFRKFFQTSGFSLNEMDKTEAKKNDDV